MTCPDCTAADRDPTMGLYRNGCKGCEARALAQGIAHAEARTLGKMTPAYMAALRTVFGGGWEAGHKEVKAWAKRIDEARAVT